ARVLPALRRPRVAMRLGCPARCAPDSGLPHVQHATLALLAVRPGTLKHQARTTRPASLPIPPRRAAPDRRPTAGCGAGRPRGYAAHARHIRIRARRVPDRADAASLAPPFLA